MRPGQSRAVFTDCAVHGAGSDAELFIVEGESAASSVAAVRSARHQAVLPLQGKPLNAWRASEAKVRSHALYIQLASALGLPDPTCLKDTTDGRGLGAALGGLRFERIVLLMDPDADGIHIGALLLMYFKRFAPVLYERGHLWMVRAPMFVMEPKLSGAAIGQGAKAALPPVFAHTPAQCQALRQQLLDEHGQAPTVHAVRGLGGLAPQLLATWCVSPATRVARCLSLADAQAAVDVFGGLGSEGE
jgi:DNA gyrase subunit B